MKIWIMRHGDAGEDAADPEEERDRPLSAEGIEQVSAVARALAAKDVRPKVVVASDYARTAETADLVGKILGVKVALTSALAPHLPARPVLEDLLADENSKRVLVVGHHDNLVPGLSEMGGDFSPVEGADDVYDGDDDCPELAKGECVRLKFDRGSGTWTAVDRVRPDDVGAPLAY